VDASLLTDLGHALVEGSLTDDSLLAKTSQQPTMRILPEAQVIKIGGQSFIDRGRSAVVPLLDELARAGCTTDPCAIPIS
jgi:molybdenum storage protein